MVFAQPLQLRLKDLDLARGDATYLLGVVNVTPDSFSGGENTLDPERAVAHGLALLAAGADLLDVGGESTRPGAHRLAAKEELARVVPVVEKLARHAPVSIDTYKAEVAAAALAAGAEIVNDISGGRLDPEILHVAARAGAALILGHFRIAAEDAEAPLHEGRAQRSFADVTREVGEELSEQVARAVEAGVPRTRILIDPGLGFGKSDEENLTLLAELGELKRLGLPIVVGASRKGFLGRLTGRPPLERELATAAAHTAAILGGASVVRVHDAAAQRDAVRVADAIRRARSSPRELAP